MARPQTKSDLLQAATGEYRALRTLLDSIPADRWVAPGVAGDWSIKDILAHLHEWHLMLAGWYASGMAGGKPVMPAPGYTWRDTPALNQAIFEKYRSAETGRVLDLLDSTHQQMVALVELHTDDELFAKKRYRWTGSTSLGAYLVSATSSHYRWAIDLIRKATAK